MDKIRTAEDEVSLPYQKDEGLTHSLPANFVTDPFSFDPGLSLQSTVDPSARCSCMLQCNSVAASGFFAVKGNARYFPGSTATLQRVYIDEPPALLARTGSPDHLDACHYAKPHSVL